MALACSNARALIEIEDSQRQEVWDSLCLPHFFFKRICSFRKKMETLLASSKMFSLTTDGAMIQRHETCLCLRSQEHFVEESPLDPRPPAWKPRVQPLLQCLTLLPPKKYTFSHLLFAADPCEQVSLENSFHPGPPPCTCLFSQGFNGELKTLTSEACFSVSLIECPICRHTCLTLFSGECTRITRLTAVDGRWKRITAVACRPLNMFTANSGLSRHRWIRQNSLPTVHWWPLAVCVCECFYRSLERRMEMPQLDGLTRGPVSWFRF